MKPSDIDQVVLVGGSTRTPRVQEIVTELFGREPHKGVNPDEVVAVGAAIQAGVLAGEVEDVLLLDVTPLSLGIETLGAVTTILIPRNTTIPTRKSEVFSTAADNQTSVEIHVLQGERDMAKDNRTLGKFHLVGIPAAPRGIPQIEVTFDIDANGILNVSAKDLGTGKEQKITVTSSSGLAKEDIDKMVDEAATHADEDKDRRRRIDARNQLDSIVYQTDKVLNENRDSIDAGSVTQIEDALKSARETLEDESASFDRLQEAQERLQTASHAMAEAMYRQASPDAGGAAGEPTGGPSGAGADEDEVIEAEVVDENDGNA
jgi:molecular chaperone DnaK